MQTGAVKGASTRLRRVVSSSAAPSAISTDPSSMRYVRVGVRLEGPAGTAQREQEGTGREVGGHLAQRGADLR